MNILLFGKLAEPAGRQIALDLPDDGCTIADLRAALVRRFPGLATELAPNRAKALIDRVIASEADWVRPDQEVALLPPLSGG